MLTKNKVAIYRQAEAFYSNEPPYNPPTHLPESPFDSDHDTKNLVYDSIRNALHLLRLDDKNFKKPNWNPLRSVINPRETVLIKPNLVSHSHQYNADWEYVITHGSVIRAIIDYVYIALKGEGRIIIADGPQTNSDIDVIKLRIGIEAIQELYWKKKNFNIEFLDLRDEYWIEEDSIHIETVKLRGDPLGNVYFDLADISFFEEHDGKKKRYYGAFYDIDETNKHHRDGVHEYMVSRTALESDVFINLPKLKTHKKVGVTLNLKGLVGINGNKNWLPHYSFGAPEEGGDQFLKNTLSSNLENRAVIIAKQLLLKNNHLFQLIARKLKTAAYALFGDTEKVVRSGNWYGNDTCWRMALDLNRILLYGRSDGNLVDVPKRCFSVVDGIIGMEGNGPLAGKPKVAGLIVAGQNPLAVDTACSKLMGFNYRKIPMLYQAFYKGAYPYASFLPNEIYILSNEKALSGNLTEIQTEAFPKFEPHFGWKHLIES